MKVSQLLHTIDREDLIVINDRDLPINTMRIYDGEVRGLKRDDPINKMHVVSIFADDDVIHILAEKAVSRND